MFRRNRPESRHKEPSSAGKCQESSPAPEQYAGDLDESKLPAGANGGIGDEIVGPSKSEGVVAQPRAETKSE